MDTQKINEPSRPARRTTPTGNAAGLLLTAAVAALALAAPAAHADNANNLGTVTSTSPAEASAAERCVTDPGALPQLGELVADMPVDTCSVGNVNAIDQGTNRDGVLHAGH
ncbi:hypothetical protein ACN20G_31395 (plasmid) [Streptomyces sp. BI20]|uniref:hypothetical protein n=1 Tax=Streptomyces sp. BI20 TaxID=3403460 RepID=UPI003C78BE84